MFRNIPFLILLAIYVQKHSFSNIACNLWKIKIPDACSLAIFWKILKFPDFSTTSKFPYLKMNSLTFPDLEKLSLSRMFSKTLATLLCPAVCNRNVQVRLLFYSNWFCLFCCFMSQVNSYGHGGTVSSPNNTFFMGKLEQAVNQ